MSSIFGGKGSGSGQWQMLQTLAMQQQMAQQTQAMTNSQGQQLALLAKSQAANDNETAQLNKPGLGRLQLAAPRRTLGS